VLNFIHRKYYNEINGNLKLEEIVHEEYNSILSEIQNK